jgi:hypothetical protein
MRLYVGSLGILAFTFAACHRTNFGDGSRVEAAAAPERAKADASTITSPVPRNPRALFEAAWYENAAGQDASSLFAQAASASQEPQERIRAGRAGDFEQVLTPPGRYSFAKSDDAILVFETMSSEPVFWTSIRTRQVVAQPSAQAITLLRDNGFSKLDVRRMVLIDLVRRKEDSWLAIESNHKGSSVVVAEENRLRSHSAESGSVEWEVNADEPTVHAEYSDDDQWLATVTAILTPRGPRNAQLFLREANTGHEIHRANIASEGAFLPAEAPPDMHFAEGAYYYRRGEAWTRVSLTTFKVEPVAKVPSFATAKPKSQRGDGAELAKRLCWIGGFPIPRARTPLCPAGGDALAPGSSASSQSTPADRQ